MKRVLALTACAALALVACGDDDDDDAADTVSPASVVGTAADTKQIIEVVATDYTFTGIPDSVPAGTTFALQNDSTKEVHEMVMIRIPDEVTETVGQLLALPEEELDAKVGEIEPTSVIVALPGELGMPMVGNGTLDEPGRYAVLCFIPVGADPAMVEEAMSMPPGTGEAEQPDLGGGAPHIAQGMYAEVLVEEGP